MKLLWNVARISSISSERSAEPIFHKLKYLHRFRRHHLVVRSLELARVAAFI